MHIQESLNKLVQYIESQQFKGYDPYDTLNSRVPFHRFGKWGRLLAIQFQKRNPINIRPLLGIKKAHNPKAMGLLLSAYSIMDAVSPSEDNRNNMKYLFQWLQENYSGGYSGMCWGYNFPWESSIKYVQPYVPSSVVTGFVCKGIFNYYQRTQDKSAGEIIKSASQFVLSDLDTITDDTGICISYTPVEKDICYNASLLAGEVLAMNYYVTRDQRMAEKAFLSGEFVIERQRADGMWVYSENPETGKERLQIDFHQGYVLVSLYNIMRLLGSGSDLSFFTKEVKKKWENALEKGMAFYREKQFFPSGKSLWRLPHEWPADIHNQSQGVITFSLLKDMGSDYFSFAQTIGDWTIQNMQDRKGYFYYKKYPYFIHKTPYMRWSQAWMFVALASLLYTGKDNKTELLLV